MIVNGKYIGKQNSRKCVLNTGLKFSEKLGVLESLPEKIFS